MIHQTIQDYALFRAYDVQRNEQIRNAGLGKEKVYY